VYFMIMCVLWQINNNNNNNIFLWMHETAKYYETKKMIQGFKKKTTLTPISRNVILIRQKPDISKLRNKKCV